jgi:hypothetical protein
MMNGPIRRYIYFCFAVIVLYSIYSYLLDQFYFNLQYGNTATYHYSILDYLVRFPIASFPASIAIPVLYNYFINELVNNARYNTALRFLCGLTIGLCLGYAVQRTGVSFYIGYLRPQKNLILYPAIGLSVEILRAIKLLRMRNKVNKLVVAALLLISSTSVSAQSKCLPDNVFFTDSLGNYNDKLPIPLRFVISKDSVLIQYPEQTTGQFAVFKIKEKPVCSWNEILQKGISTLVLGVEADEKILHPKLNIVFKNGYRIIELRYENSEVRVFTIRK